MASFPVPRTPKTFNRFSDQLSTNSKNLQQELTTCTTPSQRHTLLSERTSFLLPPTCLRWPRRWGYLGMDHTTIVDSARSMASTKAISIAHYEHLMATPSNLPSIMILLCCLFETMPRTGELRARRFNMKPSTLLLKEEQSTESHNIQSSTN